MSEIEACLRRLHAALGPRAGRLALEMGLDEANVTELASANHDWSLWARDKQLPPPGDWKAWGFLTGRSWGKTVTISSFVNAEVEAGRARMIGLAAQNEATCVDVQVLGPSGLVATSPPWCKAEWHAAALQVSWPNGARAFVRSPEAPSNIRGLDLDLAWLSEIQSWPVVNGQETLMNFAAATRQPGCRLLWDGTPKSRHPLVKALLAEAEAHPGIYRITRGKMDENAGNLDAGYVARMRAKYGGTQQGREEIDGEMLSEAENALFRAPWIDLNRRPLPALARRAIGVDPATAGPGRGRDMTGIVEAGLGVDGRLYVIRDDSAKFDLPETWGELLIDHYFAHGVDIVAVECNAGGAFVSSVIRSAGRSRGVKIEQVKRGEPCPPRRRDTVFVREVFARPGQGKDERAAPLSIAYQKNLVCHAQGSSLRELEDQMLSWDPAQKNDSPDRLDALVWCASELLDLTGTAGPDPRSAFVGLERVTAALVSATPTTRTVSGNSIVSFGNSMSHLMGFGGGERIP